MSEFIQPLPTRKNRPLALVLQGGGALGAFQYGAFEALHAQDLHPFWIAGTSIGAINGAIIAGNAPKRALERLETFWSEISTPDPLAPPDNIPGLRQAYNYWSAMRTVVAGQPNFFTPRAIPPFMVPSGKPSELGFYEVKPLKSTLERLVDFDRINAREVRFSLGAVEVETGTSVYFDNHRQKIGPEHVLASAALPPAFPPVEVDGKHYWDGGIASNTPIETILDTPPSVDLLILVVDLWDPHGKMPSNLIEAQARVKAITYASRAADHIRAFERVNALRGIIHELYQKIPPADRTAETERHAREFGCPHTVDILHLLYEEASSELASKDYEFSRSSVVRHHAQGFAQAERVLVERGWCAPASVPGKVRIYEAVLPQAKPAPKRTAAARARRR